MFLKVSDRYTRWKRIDSPTIAAMLRVQHCSSQLSNALSRHLRSTTKIWIRPALEHMSKNRAKSPLTKDHLQAILSPIEERKMRLLNLLDRVLLFFSRSKLEPWGHAKAIYQFLVVSGMDQTSKIKWINDSRAYGWFGWDCFWNPMVIWTKKKK